MKQYLDLLQRVLDEGVRRDSRDHNNGGRMTVFGHSMNFIMDDLPLISYRDITLNPGCSCQEEFSLKAKELDAIDNLFATLFYWGICEKGVVVNLFWDPLYREIFIRKTENETTSYSPQIPNGPLHQRRNRRERRQAAFLREGGEIRRRYAAHSELYRDRHRRFGQEVSIGGESVRDISQSVLSRRVLSLMSNLTPEA